MTELSVVIPCHNEEDNIEACIRGFCAVISQKTASFEILVVEDGSSDQTPAILSRLEQTIPELRVLRPSVNLGHGGAIRMGYEAAEGAWIFQTDSDNQYDPADFLKLYEKTANFDFILGWRRLRHDPPHRRMLSTGLRVLLWILFGVQVKDPNCPFRLMRHDFVKSFLAALPPEVFILNTLLSVTAWTGPSRRMEIEIRHFARSKGVSIHGGNLVRAVFRGGLELLQFRIGNQAGKINNALYPFTA